MAESGSKIQLEDVRQTVTCGICLQLFTDPRSLSCSHSYCLVCLQGFQKSSSKKECPVCRAMSIPNKHDLDKLPTNTLAADLVKLVHSYEPSAIEEPPVWKPDKAKSTKPTSTTADESSSDSDDDTSLDLNAALHGALQQLQGNLQDLQMLSGLSADTDVGQLRQLLESAGLSDGDDWDGTKHSRIICDNCKKSGFSGARYKCGICDDFDLCEDCEKKPRQEVHPTDVPHVFVKIKKPARAPYPKHRILDEDSEVMALTMDVTKHEHKLYMPPPDSKDISIGCDNCAMSPIIGIRYKCGSCQDYDLCETCEKTSAEFHDEDHLFLVFRHPVSYHTNIPQLTYDFYAND